MNINDLGVTAGYNHKDALPTQQTKQQNKIDFVSTAHDAFIDFIDESVSSLTAKSDRKLTTTEVTNILENASSEFCSGHMTYEEAKNMASTQLTKLVGSYKSELTDGMLNSAIIMKNAQKHPTETNKLLNTFKYEFDNREYQNLDAFLADKQVPDLDKSSTLRQFFDDMSNRAQPGFREDNRFLTIKESDYSEVRLTPSTVAEIMTYSDMTKAPKARCQCPNPNTVFILKRDPE